LKNIAIKKIAQFTKKLDLSEENPMSIGMRVQVLYMSGCCWSTVENSL